jgi:hypothetical protein
MNGMAADWELGVSKRERLGIFEQQHPLLVWPQIESITWVLAVDQVVLGSMCDLHKNIFALWQSVIICIVLVSSALQLKESLLQNR